MSDTEAQHDDDLMLAELGIDTEPQSTGSSNPKMERLRSGFEEILNLHERHQRSPNQANGRADIFARLMEVRLQAIRENDHARDVLAETYHDTGLLTVPASINQLNSRSSQTIDNLKIDVAERVAKVDDLDDDELLTTLGLAEELATEGEDISKLTHVRPAAERNKSSTRRNPAHDIAQRTICQDFERFLPRFRQVAQELQQGTRKTVAFGQKAARDKGASVEAGDMFILNGQLLQVVEKGTTFLAPNLDTDAKLRVVYDNGTESGLLMRSLKRALIKDRHGRRVEPLEESDRRISQLEHGRLIDRADPSCTDGRSGTSPAAPLPSGHETGTIYVLRSKSTDPYITKHREVIHKIGVTGGSVKKRVANAKHEPTYLMADVDIVATYTLHNIDRHQLESLLHRFFGNVQIDLSINDRFGRPVQPKEWFLVPLPAIDEAVRRIQDRSIIHYRYAASKGCLVRIIG